MRGQEPTYGLGLFLQTWKAEVVAHRIAPEENAGIPDAWAILTGAAHAGNALRAAKIARAADAVLSRWPSGRDGWRGHYHRLLGRLEAESRKATRGVAEAIYGRVEAGDHGGDLVLFAAL